MNIREVLNQFVDSLQALLDMPKKLDEVHRYLLTPASMKIELSKGETMAKKFTGKMKLDIRDDGTATATITNIKDAAGLATKLPDGVVPAWSSSDPGVVVTAAPDGMSASLAPSSPPVAVNGVVISASATVGDTTVSAQSEAINVVPGPASSFVIEVA